MKNGAAPTQEARSQAEAVGVIVRTLDANKAGKGARVTDVKPNPLEIYRFNAEGELTRRALRERRSLSDMLEELDPSSSYNGDDARLDAFGRQMRVAGIRTLSDEARGIYADPMDKFFEDGNRSLMHEWACRRWREARFGVPANPNTVNSRNVINLVNPDNELISSRQILTSVDEGLGSVWRPYTDMAGERASIVTPAIPLSMIVSRTTAVTSKDVRMRYMTDPTADELRMFRVTEGAEIPLSKYRTSKHAVHLYKYGRGIELTYEAVKEEPIDRVAFWLQRQAVQNENDKVSAGLDAIINGDGNNNATSNYDKTDMQAGSSGDPLTLRGWLSFLAQFSPNYSPSIAFAHFDDYVTILTMTTGNSNTPAGSSGYAGGVSQVRPIASQVVDLVKWEGLPSNIVLAIDQRFCLEHLTQIGMDITESDNFITRQTQVLVMTEVDGFDIIDQKASGTLTMNA